MNVLFVCNTYYQLMIAIQLKITSFKNDKVTVWLSNHSVNYERVYKRLTELDLFDSLNLVKTKREKHNHSKLFMMKKINKQLEFYDEIIFYNLEELLYGIYATYNKQNHIVTWSKMEEGIFSYKIDFFPGKCTKIIQKLCEITNHIDITNKVKNYYCFFPDLKENIYNWNIITIPSINIEINRLRKILNYIFDYKPIDYKQKYIFFASSSDIDGHSFGETELVLKIAEYVGKENLLVKMHPRDNRDIFKKHGITIMKNSYVPWEVVQLNLEKNEYIMLTVNSTAFINITSLLNQNVKGYFLYSYIKNPDEMFVKRSKEISDILEKLHSLNVAKNITSSVDAIM